MKNSGLKTILFIAFSIVLVLPFIFETFSLVSAQTFNFKYGTTWPETHFFTVADKNFIKKVEKETNGRLKFTVFAGGTLISTKESLAELKNKVVEMSYINTDYAPGFQVLKAGRSFYYGAPDVKTSREIYAEVLKKYPQLEEEFEGVKIMARVAMPQPYQILTTKKPIRTIADLKGLKLKVATPLVPPLKALGAEGIAIPLSQTYVALEKGIIDGCLLPLDTFKSFAFHEIIKYTTRLDYYMGPYPARAFNIEIFNSLPKDIQKVLEDNIEFWGEEVDRLGYETIKAGIEAAKKANVEFLEFEPGELDKFYDALSDTALVEAKKVDGMGLPGTKIFEDVRALIKKYSK